MRWRTTNSSNSSASSPNASPSEDPRHIKSEYPIYPEPMFGAYKERREEHGVQLYGSLGIDRDDAAGRLAQYKRNFEFFNAPVALFIAIDRRLGPGQWADLGGYIHTLAYLARGYGLDTCPQEAWARLYDTVGEFIKLPPEQMLFCAHRDRLRRPQAQGQRLPLAARGAAASSASFMGSISVSVVVPAKAGTHNHHRKSGSPPSRGRQRRLVRAVLQIQISNSHASSPADLRLARPSLPSPSCFK